MRTRAPWLLPWLALQLAACDGLKERFAADSPTPAPTAQAQATPVPTPAPPFRNRGEVVDCRPFDQAPLGSTWFVFDDHNQDRNGPGCHHGTSSSMLERLLSHPVGDTCAVRWSGTVTSVHPFGFAGMGIDLDVNIGGYEKIVLEVRGDGRRYRAQFPLPEQAKRAEADGCDSRDYDFYGSVFRCGDGSSRWQEVTLDLHRLKQEGWGNRWPLSLDRLDVFQIRTLDRPLEGFQCDVLVKRLIVKEK